MASPTIGASASYLQHKLSLSIAEELVLGKELVSNIYKNNDGINEDELNYRAQQTIARIIFLRIA